MAEQGRKSFRKVTGDNERVLWGLALGLLTMFAWPNLVVRLHGLERIPNICKQSDYCMYFNSMDGAARQKYSKPLEGRFRESWDKVVAKARAEGFAFKEPEPFQTTPEFDSLHELGGTYYGLAWYSNRVYLNAKYMGQMTDSDLCHLQAHELGHQVDMQTERLGHRHLHATRDLPMQMFADEFSVVICGRPSLEDFREKWQHSDWLEGVF